MTEAEYLASVDPAAMLAQFVPPAGRSSRTGHNLNSFPTTDRRLRLFACACWRVRMGRYFLKYRDYSVSDYGEAMADGHELPPERPQPLLGGDWDYYPLLPDAAEAARRMCENACPEDAAGFAALLRCLVGNPWSPVRFERRHPKCPGCGCRTLYGHVEGEQQWFYCKECYHKVLWSGDWTGEVRPSWLTPTVRHLAHSIYDDRRFEETGVLADALEEAGATDPALLGHLRETDRECPEPSHSGHFPLGAGVDLSSCYETCKACRGTGRVPAPHARGCHVLDALLGKE